jgi:regulator of cell morphogenesis and NO signaling
MTLPSRETTVSELTRSIPGAARVFERYGIDFCCGGKRPLEEACAVARAPVDEVVRALSETRPDPREVPVPEGLSALVDHVLSTHHVFEREELLRLSALAEKVARVHGGRHPETQRVASLFAELRADMEPHMHKEEQVLFPYMRRLAAGQGGGSHFGSIQNPIRMMHMEHERVGELLHELSEATDRYTPPADACNSYRALYDGLASLQADVHQHIHVENERMFPLALALEAGAEESAAR